MNPPLFGNKAVNKFGSHISKEFLLKAHEDILTHINESIPNLKSDEDKLLYNRFWSRLCGVSERDITAADIRASFWGVSPLCGMFYLAHYDKCPKERIFPAKCPYEVFLPYSESDNNFMKAYFFPSGLDVGDKAVFYYTFLPSSPPNTELLRDAFNAPGPLEGTKLNDLANKLTPTDQSKVSIGYGFGPIPFGPFLRLPCYSVPWQCSYELVSDAIGDYWQDGLLIRQMVLEGKTPKCSPLEHKLWLIMVAYPFWEMIGLSNNARLEQVNMFERTTGENESYKGINQWDALRKKIDRTLDNFIKRTHVRKVITKTK